MISQVCHENHSFLDCRENKTWALSYDDGPSNYTHIVLDALHLHNYTATFFVIGRNVLSNPQILVKAHEAGHTIGIHTWSHPFLTTLTNGIV
jgi:peptidoglycan/xylan/chitin deacetylase (PgdA/CDA1 family)